MSEASKYIEILSKLGREHDETGLKYLNRVVRVLNSARRESDGGYLTFGSGEKDFSEMLR